MNDGLMVAIGVLAIVFATMIGEALVSRRNERWLRAQGAHEPRGDVYQIMTVAYPLCFLGMGIEHAIGRETSAASVALGAAIFIAAKALKYWAAASLGTRWTFRVLVVPGAPLVASGPYRWLRHPNYVAVAGELVGVAIALEAPATGLIGTSAFVALMLRRVRVEEKALGLR